MKTRKGLSLVLVLTFLLTVLVPGGLVFAETSINLHADGTTAQVVLVDTNFNFITEWAGLTGVTDGTYTMDKTGLFKLTDEGTENLPMIYKFIIDGEDYILNPNPANPGEVRDERIRIGEEGQLGSGTNNYWIGDMEYAIAIDKVADKASYYTGETIYYTVNLYNIGSKSLDNIDVIDTLALDTPLETTLADDYNGLPSGGMLTFNYSYTIPSDFDGDELTNTVVATAIRSNGPNLIYDLEVSDTVTVDIMMLPLPSVDVNKTATLINGQTPEPFEYSTAGDIITYQVTITNDGNVPLDTVSLGDSLVISLGSPTGDTGSDGILDVDETWTYTYTYTVTQADVDAGSVSNTATGTAYYEETPVSDEASAIVYANQDPSIDVTKTATLINDTEPDPFIFTAVDDVITYVVTVENDGNVTLTSVTLDDTLVDSLGTPTGDTGDDGELAPGETWTYTYTYTVVQADLEAGSVANLATATAYFGQEEVSDEDDATVYAEQTPSIDVTKTATMINDQTPDPLEYSEVGDVITYVVTIENDGNVALTDVELGDTLVENPGTPTGDANQNEILDPGETWTYTYTYTVTQDDIEAGQVDNTATGTGYFEESPVIDEDSETVYADQGPSIVVIKTATLIDGQTPVPFEYSEAGEVITYVVTVENDGNVALTDVELDDTLVENPGTPTGDTNQNEILDPGETWTYTYTYTVTQDDIDAGQVDNTASALAYFGDTPVSDEDSETVYADQNPSIDVVKNATLINGDTPEPFEYSTVGDIITFVVTVENDGNVSLDQVEVEDTMVEDIGDPANDDGNDGVLSPGETWAYSYTYTITQGDIELGQVYNTVYAEAYFEDTKVSDEDNETVLADRNPSIDVTKTATLINGDTPEPFVFDEPGDVITYVVTVENNGNVSLGNIGSEDTLVDEMGDPSGDVGEDERLSPGEVWTFTYTYTVTQEDIDNGQVDNLATAFGYFGDTRVTDEDDATVYADEVWEVSIEKTVNPGTVTAGQSVTYTIVVTNTGNVTLVSGMITDEKLDISQAFEGPLAPGATITINAQYTTSAQDIPQVLNTASVEAYTGNEDQVSDEDTATLNVNPVPVTYTVTYLPGAHGSLSGTTVTSGLPLGVPTPSAPTVIPQSGWVFTGWSPTVSPLVTGNATYTAQYSPLVINTPAISVTIEPDADFVDEGTDVTFTMVVTNTGNTILNNVEVTNEDLDFETVIPVLGVGGSQTFTVVKNMDESGEFTFTVVAVGTSPQVVSVSDEDDTLVVVIPPEEPPLNPPTGAIPFNALTVSGLMTLGAGILALIKRKKEDDEEE